MNPAALLFIGFVGVLLPWAAWRSGQRLKAAGAEASLSRRSFYVSAFTIQFLTLGLALGLASSLELPLLGPFSVQPLAWATTAAVLGLLLATLPWRWRTRTPEQKRRQALLAPHTPAEGLLHTALCFLAGIGEELVYRRVLHACVWWLTASWWPGTGSWWIASLFCALSFGVSHAVQGGRAILIVTGVALWMHATVLWTGSLHTAMVAHVVYDLIAVFTIARWVRRDPEARAPTQAQA